MPAGVDRAQAAARLPHPDSFASMEALRGLAAGEVNWRQATYGVPVPGNMTGRVDLRTGTLHIENSPPPKRIVDENLQRLVLEKIQSGYLEQLKYYDHAEELHRMMMGDPGRISRDEATEQKGWIQTEKGQMAAWVPTYAEADPEGGNDYIPDDKWKEMLDGVQPGAIRENDGVFYDLSQSQRQELLWKQHDEERFMESPEILDIPSQKTLGQFYEESQEVERQEYRKNLLPENWRGRDN